MYTLPLLKIAALFASCGYTNRAQVSFKEEKGSRANVKKLGPECWVPLERHTEINMCGDSAGMQTPGICASRGLLMLECSWRKTGPERSTGRAVESGTELIHGPSGL
jgi:hypothetical protein